MKHRRGYLYQRGGVYWLQYRVEGRTVRESLGTGDAEAAEEKRKEIMRPLMAADRVDALTMVQARLADAKTEQTAADEAANPPLTIGDAWGAYEKATNRPDSSERTLAGYESAWKRFAKWVAAEHPGRKAMREIDTATASAYATHLNEDGVTASTFNQHVGLLRLVWRVLAERSRGNGNPWMQIQKKRVQKLAHRRRTITPEQFKKLLASADSADLHALLFTLGMTGQRLFDAIHLRWDAIDFKRRVITLHPRKTARTGKAVFVPLLPALAKMLEKRRDMVGGELAFPELAAEHDRDGSAIPKRIQKAFARAGLTPRENMPGVKRAVAIYGAHSLRHFFATSALSAGIPAEIVKRITGHTSDAMLEGYEHVDAAMIGGLARKLGNRKALPAATDAVLRERVRALAEGMNAKTWQTVKAKLLALAAGSATAQDKARLRILAA